MAKRITIPITDHNTSGVCTQYYQVEYKMNGEVGYSFSQMMFASPIVLDNMLENTIYDVRITRICCDNVTSTPVIFTVDTTEPEDPEDLVAPTNFTAIQSGSNAVLNWDDMGGADSYELQRATNSGFTTGLATPYIGTTSGYTNSGLAGGTYYFRVRSLLTGNPPGAWATTNLTLT